jgi:hypothetical protein
MVSHKSASGPPIQKLIDEREQIGQWLEKLANAADKPEAMRAKVRSGYEKRLAEIMAELQGYQKEIEETLKRQRAAYEVLQKKEKEATEELAEAELRHSVGEFTEAGWRKTSAEITSTLSKVREGLTAGAESVARIEATLASLGGSAPAAPAAAPNMRLPDAAVPRQSRLSEFIPDPDPVVPTVSAPVARANPSADPSVDPKAAPPSEPPAPPAPRPSAPVLKPKPPEGLNDELAFLKSVTDDDKQAPSPARASGMARLSSSEPVIPDKAIIEAQGKQPARPAPKPTAPAPAPASTEGGGQGGAKTVKCKDCGTMNLPTEWYCEKCGAELSAL